MAKQERMGLGRRLLWLAAGVGPERVVAFDWIRGRVGSRQNPDGMRSLLHLGLLLLLLCAAVDVLLLARASWRSWRLLGFVHVAWTASFVFGTVLNVGFLESLEGEQRRSAGLPNALTLLRGVIIPSIAYAILVGDARAAFFLYAGAASTDVLDGFLARHLGQTTKLGIVLDPIVDILFHLGALGSLALAGLLGLREAVLVGLRSFLLVAGAGLFYLWKGQVRILPTPLGKGTGLLLSLSTLAMLLAAGWLREPGGVLLALRGMIGVLLILAVLHVLAIGAINMVRLPTGGSGRNGA